MRRRDLLRLIGSVAGSTVMYQAMGTLGLNAESTYNGAMTLDGDPKGASVLILGAGLAGMVAALELRKAGYKVQLLEYQNRAGGRCWTIRGGDSYTELGGATQTCHFDEDLYLNPGPWRIPSHHHGVIDYCRRLGVALEPFMQVNQNRTSMLRTRSGASRSVSATSMRTCRALSPSCWPRRPARGSWTTLVTAGDKELLLQALRNWGALDAIKYTKGPAASDRRGFDKDPGGGLNANRRLEPLAFSAILQSRVWQRMADGDSYYHHTPSSSPSAAWT